MSNTALYCVDTLYCKVQYTILYYKGALNLTAIFYFHFKSGEFPDNFIKSHICYLLLCLYSGGYSPPMMSLLLSIGFPPR